MSKLLDKKMPGQKRRRPVAWWWMAAMWLLPLVGAGTWWWAEIQDKSKQEYRPDTQSASSKASIVDATRGHGQMDNQNSAARKTPEKTFSEGSLKPVAPAPAGPIKPAQTAQREATNYIWPALSKNIPAQQAIPALQPGDQADATERSDADDNLHMEQLALLTAANLTLTTLPTRFQLLESTANTHNLLPITPTKRAKAITKPKKKQQPRQLRIGATLGMATERFAAANSLLAGATLDWQPLRHWGLRSGLMYERYRPSGFARPIAEIDADEYADATRNYAFLFNNGVYVPGTSEALGLDVALPVTMMQRLRTPLLAYWQPAKWVRLYGGSSFSYTLLVHTSSKGLAFDSELVGARSPTSLANVNKLATNELPRFQAQLQTGFGIRLGKHWEVEMAYRQSAKIQFKSLFEKRVEDGQAVNTMNFSRRPNHHFFSIGGIYFF